MRHAGWGKRTKSRFRYRLRPRMLLVSVRENLWLKKHAGTAEPFSVLRPKAMVLAINEAQYMCCPFQLGSKFTFYMD
jgi:hypothetical protein